MLLCCNLPLCIYNQFEGSSGSMCPAFAKARSLPSIISRESDIQQGILAFCTYLESDQMLLYDPSYIRSRLSSEKIPLTPK
jgi:hypothetical protein